MATDRGCTTWAVVLYPARAQDFDTVSWVLKCANTGRLCQIEKHRGKMYITGYTPEGRRKYVLAENIEAQVVQILDTIRPSQEAMDFVTDVLKGTKKAEENWRESETRRINLEICENSRRIDALVDMFIDKKIDQDVYQTKLEQLKARGEELQKITGNQCRSG